MFIWKIKRMIYKFQSDFKTLKARTSMLIDYHRIMEARVDKLEERIKELEKANYTNSKNPGNCFYCGKPAEFIEVSTGKHICQPCNRFRRAYRYKEE